MAENLLKSICHICQCVHDVTLPRKATGWLKIAFRSLVQKRKTSRHKSYGMFGEALTGHGSRGCVHMWRTWKLKILVGATKLLLEIKFVEGRTSWLTSVPSQNDQRGARRGRR